MNEVAIAKKAFQFRNDCGLSSEDSVNIKNLLRKVGVIAYFTPLSTEFSGMAVKQAGQNFILVNTAHSIGRQNFTVAHELYHLFVQADFTIETTLKVGAFDNTKHEEFNADMFASYFLMPEDGIIALIPDVELENKEGISLDTVIKLEQYFAVSRMAILYRLKNLKIITNTKIENYSQNVKSSALRRGFSDELYSPTNHTELIGDYGSLANSLVESDLISDGDFYSLMLDIGVDIINEKPDSPDE